MSDIMRITGMVTGLDTDELVEDLLNAEQVRVDRVEQDKQYIEWKQEDYRGIINSIREFRDEYFNYLNSDSNLRSSETFNTNTVTLDDSTLSTYLEVNADSDTIQGDYTISNITTAKTARAVSTGLVTADIQGISLTTPITIDSSNNKFYLGLNEDTETITITSGEYSTLTDFADEIQSRIYEAFGSGKISVQLTGASSDQLLFTTDSTNTLSLSQYSENDGLTVMGFASVSGTDDDISFTINEQTFTFSSETTSLAEVMEEVNASDLDVNMYYDELNDKFVIESEDTGEVTLLEINDVTGNLMSVLNLDGQSVRGSDATITYNDGSGSQTVTRSDNSFSINGLDLDLIKDYSGDIGFSVRADAEILVEKISGFVEEYNELIDLINDKLTEERNYDYRPLTDAQKEDMEEEEIELWEEQARKGILRNDSILQGMVTNMRKALYEEVEGVGLSFFELGIDTSSNYGDYGKLVIDEDTLTQVIEDNPDKVAQLFTTDSETYETTGISGRLYDIVQENITTTRNENGYKGALLERAGIEGDLTEYNNFLSDRIDEYDQEIEDLLTEISRKEDYYYNMFARMESAIAQMNNQSAWLTSQFGMGE